MPAEIKIVLKSEAHPVVLTLPSRYKSDQWLRAVCETLEDAEEVSFCNYRAAEDEE